MTKSAAGSGSQARRETRIVGAAASRLAVALAVVLCAGIAGCNRGAPAPAASVAAGEDQQAGEAPNAAAEPVRFSPFQVDVTLSPAAQAKLQAGRETIVVDADYFGAPVPAAIDLADDVGQLDLGRDVRELSAAGSANFDGSGLQTDMLDKVEGAPQVNINVYSGRKSSPDNLLACDFFQDSLDAAASAPIAVHCTLIDEEQS